MKAFKTLLESRLGWGSSERWRHSDFTALSEKILDATGVQLSITTLKRVLGRIEYNSLPQTSTLNALAQYLGYENWLAFTKENQPQLESNTSITQKPTGQNKGRSSSIGKLGRFAIAITTLTLIALSWVLVSSRDVPHLSQSEIDKILFKSKAVAYGVPNTVVFNYDITHLNGENFQIQQTWDERKRFAIPKERKEATSTYYLPGYWRAKLVVDGQVVKQHDIYIKHDSWMAMIEKEPVPRYLSAEEMQLDGQLSVSENVLSQLHNSQEGPQLLSYHFVNDQVKTDGDNFTLEADIQNTYERGDGVCRTTKVVLLGTKGAVVIPLSIPGCTGDLGLMLNDVFLNGKDHDLSALGCDFNQIQHFKYEVKDMKVSISLNDELAYQTSYNEAIGQLVGLRFRFYGSGIIDNVSIYDAHKSMIYQEDFDPSNVLAQSVND